MKGRDEAERKTEDYIQRYLQTCPEILTEYYYSLANKSFNTKKTYLACINGFFDSVGNKNIEDITELDINKYIYNKDFSKSRMTTSFYAISSFFKWAKKNGYVENNICLEMELPRFKVEPKVVYLDKEESQALYKSIDEYNSRMEMTSIRDKALIRLALHSGLRASAISYINMEDLDLDNNIIRVTEKEDFTRDVFIDDKTKSYIEDWIYERNELLYGKENISALFVTRKYTRASAQAINELVKKYAQGITDKKITAHKLRATFATNIYEATGDIYVTSSLLGHASVETTKRYVNVDNQRKMAAIKALEDV